MAWTDLFKIWSYVNKDDPISNYTRKRNIEGGGYTTDTPDIRNDGGLLSKNNTIQLRDSKDLVEMSSAANRLARYKDYERLRSVAEIETALTVFADESCVTGDTRIATPFGYIPIKQLAEEKESTDEFLVYCYDFKKEEYTLGWAFHPRLVKKEKTIKIVLENGSSFTCTSDHRVLLRTAKWVEAGQLKPGDQLMPFYRINPEKSGKAKQQFARIYTLKDSWRLERDFIDEWRYKTRSKKSEKTSKIIRMMRSGLNSYDMSKLMKLSRRGVKFQLETQGHSYQEILILHKRYADQRTVIKISDAGEQDVYDMSVKDHENFATDTTIFHNCQKGENGHLFEIECKNKDIKEELDFLFFHPRMLNLDNELWNLCKNLYLHGDHFIELILDDEDPKKGILRFQTLPPWSMYRIETNRSRLLEFQQSTMNGPDYQSLLKDVLKSTPAELEQCPVIRFTPKQIIHFRIGDSRQTFYPYGISLVEPARGPANNLRLMEDSMLVYRLTRSTERKVFYIDVGGMPPFKAEGFMDRMKDMLRKRKTFNSRGGNGASGVNEVYTPPSVEEDIWIPLRQNSNTRVETLPGATALGEIDDCLYFRNKLFVALNFPKSYMSQDDTSLTKVTLSSVNVTFAKLVERLQSCVSQGLTEIAMRHLELRGFPESLYEDLTITMTPPSAHREMSQNEVMQVRFDRAMAVKGSMMFSDIDVLTRILKIPLDEAKEIYARSTAQKIKELELQIMAQKPELMGIAMPTPPNEMGTSPDGANPPLDQMPQEGGQPPQPPGQPPEQGQEPKEDVLDSYGKPDKPQGEKLPDPHPLDIKRYNLEIMDMSKEIDEEELDASEVEEQ